MKALNIDLKKKNWSITMMMELSADLDQNGNWFHNK